jgi:hypothetical protein
MSQKGQKRTTDPRPKSTVVGFGPKADKLGRGWVVRYQKRTYGPDAPFAPHDFNSVMPEIVATHWEHL